MLQESVVFIEVFLQLKIFHELNCASQQCVGHLFLHKALYSYIMYFLTIRTVIYHNYFIL
jgi:hypothetical protein